MASAQEKHNTDSDDSDWSEVEHDGYGDLECLCLFCDVSAESANQILSHVTQQHNIDIQEFIKIRGLSFHDVIRMINYIRMNRISAQDLAKAEPPYTWECDKYYPPFLKDDPLLTYEFNAP